MQNLLLRQRLFPKVCSGEKKATSRKGHREIRKGPLLLIMTEDETEQVCVNVNSVVYIPFCKLSQNEATIEGYNNVEELKNELVKIYGEIDDNEEFTLIYWD